MKLAKVISLIGVIAMTVALLNGFINGDFSTEGSWIISNPWGIISLVDLYVGFILFAMWIIYRESSRVSAILWTISLMILGFFIGALYVFIELMRSKNDWNRFFLGKHATSTSDQPTRDRP